MNLNKDIIDFKEPELRKKVDRIQYEREMTSIAIFLFLEKLNHLLNTVLTKAMLLLMP